MTAEKIEKLRNKAAQVEQDAPLMVKPFLGGVMELFDDLVDVIESQQNQIEALKEEAFNHG